MTRVWKHINNALQAGKNTALISVVKTSGSTPREVGARIILTDAGGFYGSIGGGNLENNAIQLAQKMLQKAVQDVRLKKHLLGPDMGQCCGGAVSILIEIFTPQQLIQIKDFYDAEIYGDFYTMGDIGSRHVAREIVPHDADLGLTDEHKITEHFGQKNHSICIFGAGHVGKALMLHLANLPFDVAWVDSRKDEFPNAVPANFTLHHLHHPHKILAQLADKTQIIIFTHDHDIDFEIVSTALQMDRFDYVGMIGSKTKKARFTSKFKKLGLSQNQINKLHSPLGITGIKSKKPQAIAISIVAEILTRTEI